MAEPIEILVVEDCDSAREGMEGFLSDQFGGNCVSISSAANGREALGRINGRTVLLLDLDMPEMDGYAVLGYLEKNGIMPRGIVITSQKAGNPHDKRIVERKIRAVYSGKVDYVPKPTNLGELGVFIEALSCAVYGISKEPE